MCFLQVFCLVFVCKKQLKAAICFFGMSDLRKIACIDVQPQMVMTKDNLTVTIDAVCFYRVLDATKVPCRALHAKSALKRAFHDFYRNDEVVFDLCFALCNLKESKSLACFIGFIFVIARFCSKWRITSKL